MLSCHIEHALSCMCAEYVLTCINCICVHIYVHMQIHANIHTHIQEHMHVLNIQHGVEYSRSFALCSLEFSYTEVEVSMSFEPPLKYSSWQTISCECLLFAFEVLTLSLCIFKFFVIPTITIITIKANNTTIITIKTNNIDTITVKAKNAEILVELHNTVFILAEFQFS